MTKQDPGLTSRILTTGGLLGLYYALSQLPLPLLDETVVEWLASESRLGLGRFGMMAISWSPFIASFLTIEILSFVLPGLKASRSQGFVGRSRLNLYSVFLGFGYAAIQAIGMVVYLSRLTSLDDNPVITHDTLLARSVLFSFLIGGSASALLIAGFISRRGIGNGFAWLMIFETLQVIVLDFVVDPRREAYLPGILWTAIFAAAVVFFFRRRRSLPVTLANGESASLEYPRLPQGVPPLGWTQALPTNLSYFALLAGFELTTFSYGEIEYFLAQSVMLIPLGWFAYFLFSSRPRVLAPLHRLLSLKPTARPERLWLLPVLLLAAATAVFPLLEVLNAGDLLLPVTFLELLLILIVGLDLVSEWRFRERHGALVSVANLDNVHLASYFRMEAERRNLTLLVRGYRLRQLYFWCFPLFKMAVLVPESDVEAAREWIDSLELTEV